MRGQDTKRGAMFSYITLERRIPADHPLRGIRRLTDRALERISGDLDPLYAETGRSSIAPERLLRTLLLMVQYSVRSERQLMEQLNYNLLFRWFVGLEMDDEVWDATVFTKNRERLMAGEVSQRLLAAVLVEARENDWLSAEHFTVDGTLIQAWAANRSFQEKSDPPARGKRSGHGGEVLLRDKVESKTDPEARLYKKAVAGQASCSATNAERDTALVMLDQVVQAPEQRPPGQAITLGADTQYQDEKFIVGLRERGVAPHVSEYTKGVANHGKNALNEAERSDARRRISQQKRKLIERVFGWAKQDRPLRQVKLRGLQRVDWFFRLVITAYNLMRRGRLIPIPAPVG
jgi:transposase